MATALIRGGTVVGAAGSATLGVDPAATADRVVDATGQYVVPGGVDAHTHMELPFGGTFASDTFETGTTAAAARSTPSAAEPGARTAAIVSPSTRTSAGAEPVAPTTVPPRMKVVAMAARPLSLVDRAPGPAVREP